SGFWRAMRGPKWTSTDYLSGLVLLHRLISGAQRGGLVSIEDDVERPEVSAIFADAPRLRDDLAVRELICETFRLMGLDLSDPARAEAAMDSRIAAHYEARQKAVGALHTLADTLPALGIVAAVIGIIRAMSVIDQAPSVIGAMIAAALLGTFLGVFLAYGIVGPVANRYGQIVDDESAFLDMIRAALSGYAAGYPARACVELARAGISSDVQPSADALAHALQAQRFTERQAAA
ncbi:MAG: MotA/TolQ/ExbB proton channel family protein, partial [Pseudomonadota bacterium]